MNPIVVENQRTGDDAWHPEKNGRIGTDAEQQVKGYASAVSVATGESIDFHVSVGTDEPFTIGVYRLGWYGGRGGRLVESSGPLQGARQPAPRVDGVTGEVRCEWDTSWRLGVGPQWTSGLHLAVFATASGWRNVTPFVVRDDRQAMLCVLLPFATYQAHNLWPMDGRTGRSLHYGYDEAGQRVAARRASVVSFDRPFAFSGLPLRVNEDLAFIRWAEERGYDLTYASSTDLDSGVVDPRRHGALVFAGHDAYWSSAMREAAATARSSLIFLSAGNGHWHTRLVASADGRPGRALACYKDGADPAPGPAGATGKWRGGSPRPAQPEQGIVGVQMLGSAAEPAALVVGEYGHWLWQGCGVSDGDQISGVVGGIVDGRDPRLPVTGARQVFVASSPVSVGVNRVVAHTSVVERRGGGLVFAAGTSRWTSALGDDGDDRIRRVTANLLDHIRPTRTGQLRRWLQARRRGRLEPAVEPVEPRVPVQPTSPPPAAGPAHFSVISRHDAVGRRVLLQRTGSGLSLPGHQHTEAQELNAHLADRLGLRVTTLDIVGEHASPDGQVSRVYLHEEHGTVPGSPSATDLVWLSPQELDRAHLVVPEHRATLRAVLDGTMPDPVRIAQWPWFGPGWFAEASMWALDRLRALGREPIGPVEQIRVRDWSTICTVQTTAGTVYFKALPPLEKLEPALTAALSAWFPDWVPKVLAVDYERGWMLTEDFGPAPRQRSRDGVIGAYLGAASVMAQMQVAVLPRVDELVALGAPAWPTSKLPESFEHLLRNPPDWIQLGQPGGLGLQEHQRLLAGLDDLARACERLVAMGVPDSLLHGDLWRGNVAYVPESQLVIFDWAAASIGHPFFALELIHQDLAGFFNWDTALGQKVIDSVDGAYLAHWADYGDDAHLRETLALSRVPGLVQSASRSGLENLRTLLRIWPGD